MLNGARKNLTNLVLNYVTYLWDIIPDSVWTLNRDFKSVPGTYLDGDKTICYLFATLKEKVNSQ
jgi:hypothetical protein